MPTSRSNRERDLEALRRDYIDALDTLFMNSDQVHQALDNAAAALT